MTKRVSVFDKEEAEKNKTDPRSFFRSMAYSYYAVVTNRKCNVLDLMKTHAKRGTCEKRICLFYERVSEPSFDG